MSTVSKRRSCLFPVQIRQLGFLFVRLGVQKGEGERTPKREESKTYPAVNSLHRLPRSSPLFRPSSERPRTTSSSLSRRVRYSTMPCHLRQLPSLSLRPPRPSSPWYRTCVHTRRQGSTLNPTHREGRGRVGGTNERTEDTHLTLQQQRHMVHTRHVVHAHDLLTRDVAEHADLALRGRVEGLRDEEAAGDLEAHGARR